MKIGRLLAIGFLTTTGIAQAPAAHKLPADLPPAGPLKAVVSPVVQQQKLANGMTVWMVQRNALPKVIFMLRVRGGDSLDPATAPGLSRLMAKAMVEGTATKSSRQIAEAAQGAGGGLSTEASSDAVDVVLDSLSEHAADALALVSDVAQRATFPEKDVELVKSNMENELRSNEAQPGFLARRAWYQVVYGDHPYHIVSASMKTLESATPAALRNLYAQTMRPDQALLVVVGSFDAAQLSQEIEKTFGGWKATGEAPPLGKQPTAEAVHKIYYLERPDSVQTTLIIGATGPTIRSEDYTYLRLANIVYGGSFGSRLTQNIREEKGYTYSPHSRYSTRRWSGEILTSEDVRNAVTGPSLKETFYELERISSGPPTASELNQAKQYLVGNTAISLQSRGSVGALLAKYWVDGVAVDYLTEQMATTQSATDTQVAQAAAKYLKPQRMNVVAVGEKSVVLEQLKPFGMEMVAAPAP